MRWVGVDFGTSNTSAALPGPEGPRLVELEPGRTSIPSALFLDLDAKALLFGSPAVAALVEGREGRFMRALKRVLGTTLMREQRLLLGRRLTLLDLLAEILSRVRAAASAEAAEEVRGVIAGRPVIFHAEPERDAQAAEDLAEAYRLAGFEDLRWLPEPEAAARASGVGDGLALVVDIGGGTSDFTLFRAGGGERTILATTGVRLGGTDADRAISLSRVMPVLGLGSRLRATFGEAWHDAPVAPFHELATWERIAFLQTPEMAREAKAWERVAEHPERIARLRKVLEEGLGFDVAMAVEAGKIEANGAGAGRIRLDPIRANAGVRLPEGALDADLAAFAGGVAAGAAACLARAGVDGAAVTHVVHVGGSSLLGPVRATMAALCPNARGVDTAVFTAVAEGLARAAPA